MSPRLRRPDASAGGLLGVLVSALVVIATIWSLPGAHADRIGIVEVTAVMAAAAAAVYVSRLPNRWPLLLGVYPILMFAGIAAIGRISPVLSTAYLGMMTVGFVYVGLVMPQGSAVVLTPLAVVSWWECNSRVAGAVTNVLVVRQLIAIAIWIGVSELLARRVHNEDRTRGQLRRAATRDPLTGLDNRLGMDTLLSSAAVGDALVLLDLDHFKNVNDEHGHAIGDLVLTDFAGVVSGELRRGDTAIRYGGEEVLLHLPAVNLADVSQVIDRIRAAWSAIAPLTTFSAGAAQVGRSGSGAEALVAADRNLYKAKAAGRNCAIL